MEADQTPQREESLKPGRLEIAHVLFTDIVGYSRLPMDEQTKVLRRLQEIVRTTREFREAQSKDQLISLPTGDGMALVFFGSPEDPAECAVEIGRLLKDSPDFELRMGVHTGPVYRVSDINANRNVAGGGINTAQRVMDCGDAGHILLSKAVADVLGQLSGWSDKLHDLGEAEVKHGVRVHLFNLHADGVGNPEVPQKVRAARDAVEPEAGGAAPRQTASAARPVRPGNRFKLGVALAAVALLAALSALAYFYFPRGDAIRSLAVLPLSNAGNDPEAEYLSDGLTESLIASLSQLPNVKVIAMTSVLRYKGQQADPRAVGRELGVDAVITGRVMQRGDVLTVSAELVEAEGRGRLWGDRYERKLSDLIAVRSEIARDVADKLRARLTGEDERKLTKGYTANPEAYQLYLRGRYHTERRTRQDLQKAIDYYRQATALDPSYALAHAGLAGAYAIASSYNIMPVPEAMLKTSESAQRALALDGNLAEAHVWLGYALLGYDYKFDEAEREFRRAVELQPNDSNARHIYSLLLTRLGRHDEALAEVRRALEIDPLSLIVNKNYGEAFFYARRFEESVGQFRKTLELDPNFAPAHISLYFVYQTLRKHAESVEALAKYYELNNDPRSAALIRESFAKGGWQGFLRYMVGARRPGDLSGYHVAVCRAELGEKDEAFTELNKAYEARSYRIQYLKVDPRLDPLRSDPRFAELMRRVGLPQ